MSYDSTQDTLTHIRRVQALLLEVTCRLEEPEKSTFDEFTPKLKATTYGSDEYKSFLSSMNVALDHHYAANSHHPQFYKNGIDGMTLIDLVEMFCDWKAATERHANGSITKSIEINKDRFKISDQLAQVLRNTALKLGWV